MLDLNTLFNQRLIVQPPSFHDDEMEMLFEFFMVELNSSADKALDSDVFLLSLTSMLNKSDTNDCRLYLNGRFLKAFPEFYAFIKNMNATSSVEVNCCEKIDAIQRPNAVDYNCMKIKSISNALHLTRWTREQTLNERQGGVSVLGSTSELLLNRALDVLVSEENYFFKSSSMQPQIRSYGDFVIMCQPNNLWMSVKSGFSRERLLASGYTNDVIGVGFFQDATEFTNKKRLKNFKKAGFLAIYLPDEPITQVQIQSGISTYDAVKNEYGESMPLNINETPLLRKLSSLHSDLKEIVDIDLKSRNLSDF